MLEVPCPILHFHRFTDTIHQVLKTECRNKQEDLTGYCSYVSHLFEFVSLKLLFISALPLIMYLTIFKSYIFLKEVCPCCIIVNHKHFWLLTERKNKTQKFDSYLVSRKFLEISVNNPNNNLKTCRFCCITAMVCDEILDISMFSDSSFTWGASYDFTYYWIQYVSLSTPSNSVQVINFLQIS